MIDFFQFIDRIIIARHYIYPRIRKTIVYQKFIIPLFYFLPREGIHELQAKGIDDPIAFYKEEVKKT